MEPSYITEILYDFDLSVILPFYKKIQDFKKILPLNVKYYNRNGIEVILVLDEPSQKEEVLKLVAKYQSISWIIVVNDNSHDWRNPAKAINVGIRIATKKYIMVCSPESFFKTDAIYKMRFILNFYKNSFAIGKVYFGHYGISDLALKNSIPYGSIMVEKKALIETCGYIEKIDGWGGEDDNIRAKLEYKGFTKILVEDAILIHYEIIPNGYSRRSIKALEVPEIAYLSALHPKQEDFKETTWGYDFSKIIFDYRLK